jgi:hypothetical protein
LGAGAEQGALRPAQHFDALQVVHPRIGVARSVTQQARLDRRFVDVEAGGRVAGRRRDAPDRNVGLAKAAGLKVQTGRDPRDVVDLTDALLVQLLLGVGGDADRHLAERLRRTGGGDDDFVQSGGFLRESA